MPRRVALFNHKGGVGKTTLAAHFSVALAAAGRKALAIDLDPQGQLALSFAAAGVRRRPDVYALFLTDQPLAEILQQPISDQPLSLITGHPDTEQVERELLRGDDPFWYEILQRRLRKAAEQWDYVLFDCHPSFSTVNQAALYYADEIWMPVRLDAYSLDSYLRLKERLVKLRRPESMITNVIPTHFDLGGRRDGEDSHGHSVTLSGQRLRLLSRARDNASLVALDALKQTFGDRITPPVRNSSLFRSAVSVGETVWTHAPHSELAHDLAAVVDRILRQEEGVEVG